MSDDWIQDIRQLMSDYEAKAPDGLLDDVKAEMSRKDPTSLPPSPSKGGGGVAPIANNGRVVSLRRYRWIAAAAAVAIIAVPVVWKLLPEAKEESAIVASLPSATRPQFVASLPSATRPQFVASLPSATRPQQTVDDSAAESAAQQTQQGAAESAAQQMGAAGVSGTTHADENEDLFAYEAPKHNGSRGFSVSAYYGGASGTGSSTGFGSDFAMSDAEPYGAYPINMSAGNSAGYLDAPKREYKAHHKQPIKVGVSVGYRINDRWSVNTGVTYSYLSTDFCEGDRTLQTQKLHYVGIPLTASYSFVKGRKAEVYVTGGGEVEKLVKGRMEYEYYEDDKVTEKRPQWSVKAAVGGAYHFTPTVSVYAEPGVSYYFDNHSDVENVYKDRKTSFSLNLGVRVNLNK